MAETQTDRNIVEHVKEYSLLKALGNVAITADGKLVIEFILQTACLTRAAEEVSKNSGETMNLLGKQSVGRDLVDKLIEAGVKVDGSVFSKKTDDRMEWLSKEIHRLTQGEN